MNTQTVVTVVAAGSMFALVLSLWILAVWGWRLRSAGRREWLARRLRLPEAAAARTRTLRLWHDGQVVSTDVPALPGSAAPVRRLREVAGAAGLKTSPGMALTSLMAFTAAAFVGMWLWTASLLAAAGSAVAVVLVFWTYVKRRIARRLALFDVQLVDALELAARSLRAGHPLGGAFRLIAEEIPAPVGSAFAEICDREDLGVSHEESMRRVAAESHHDDMKLFASSVAIQVRAGGNLADMMERLALVIRDRMRLNRRIRVLTAQTHLSKNVLLALPFVLFFVLNLLNPRYLQTLYQTAIGRWMLVAAGIGLLVGAWVMKRLSVLRY